MQVADLKKLYGDVRGNVRLAAILLVLDLGLSGSFIFSAISCPIWMLVNLFEGAIKRPGWGLALARIGIPALTFAVVLANNSFQLKVGEANARRVIAACEAYHADNRKFPRDLKELIPQYMDSIPVAKHCLGPSRIFYYYYSESPMLIWQIVPPGYRKIYKFDTRSWSYLD